MSKHREASKASPRQVARPAEARGHRASRSHSHPARRRVIGVGVVVAALFGTGIAYANWSATGTGAATAKAGAGLAVNSSVAAIASSATLLYPNGTGVPLTVNIHNPNSYRVLVSAINVPASSTPTVTGANNNVTCAASSGVSVTAVNATGLSVYVNANSDATTVVGTNPVSMAVTSDDTCQNGVFSFPATVTAAAG